MGVIQSDARCYDSLLHERQPLRIFHEREHNFTKVTTKVVTIMIACISAVITVVAMPHWRRRGYCVVVVIRPAIVSLIAVIMWDFFHPVSTGTHGRSIAAPLRLPHIFSGVTGVNHTRASNPALHDNRVL